MPDVGCQLPVKRRPRKDEESRSPKDQKSKRPIDPRTRHWTLGLLVSWTCSFALRSLQLLLVSPSSGLPVFPSSGLPVFLPPPANLSPKNPVFAPLFAINHFRYSVTINIFTGLFCFMKRVFAIAGLLWASMAFSQNAYEIKVTFKPFKNQFIYLGHYFGKSYPIIDSVLLDANSQGVFKGPNLLPGGIYLIGYPNKAGFFEILIDKQQKFTVIADTSTIRKGAQYLNSPDNTAFTAYQQKVNVWGQEIAENKKQLAHAKTSSDSAEIIKKITLSDSLIRIYREGIIKNSPGSILSVLLNAMKEPQIPEKLRTPKTRADSLNAYRHFKDHYWDGVDFWDGRLAYTTFFEDKVEKYINEVVPQHPDSLIYEIDYMLGFASISPEMTRALLLKFVNRYLNQKYMFEDKIYVHIFEKYFAQKDYPWLTVQGKKTLTDRYYRMIDNILGTPATDIVLPDTANVTTTLYKQPNNFTILIFWDPTCGHCKELAPKLDSLYKAKWKASGVGVFAIAKETDGTIKTWHNEIDKLGLQAWTHVYYSSKTENERIKNNIPGYSQLYDVQSFPTLYLLDKEKRIVAKKLTLEQIDEVLQMKLKGQ
jgi:thiol-disulfide isomerase/thioredoxin